MRRALILSGVAVLVAAGGFALAQTPTDPIGEVPNQAQPRREPVAKVEPTPTPKIDPSDVTDIPVPDATPVDPRPVTPTIPPDKRPRYPIAIIQALDKITAQTSRFEAPVGQAVRYRNLIVTVRSCEATAQDEVMRDAMAHVEIAYQPTAPAGEPIVPPKTVYRGWMFAASPSLSPLEHPTYDAWLIACKATDPVTPPARTAVSLPIKGPSAPAAKPAVALPPAPKTALPNDASNALKSP